MDLKEYSKILFAVKVWVARGGGDRAQRVIEQVPVADRQFLQLSKIDWAQSLLPQMTRVFSGSKAADQRTNRSQFPRQSLRWTAKEELQLMDLIGGGASFDQAALQLGRTISAVVQRHELLYRCKVDAEKVLAKCWPDERRELLSNGYQEELGFPPQYFPLEDILQAGETCGSEEWEYNCSILAFSNSSTHSKNSEIGAADDHAICSNCNEPLSEAERRASHFMVRLPALCTRCTPARPELKCESCGDYADASISFRDMLLCGSCFVWHCFYDWDEDGESVEDWDDEVEGIIEMAEEWEAAERDGDAVKPDFGYLEDEDFDGDEDRPCYRSRDEENFRDEEDFRPAKDEPFEDDDAF